MAWIPAAAMALSSIVGGISGAHQQSQDNSAANALMGTETSTIQGLNNEYFNSYLPDLNSLLSSAYSGYGPIGDLLNFQGLKPEEMSWLTNTLGNSGDSTIKTLMSRLGGVANPNALARDLFTQNRQQGMQTTLGLGAQGAQQELSARESGAGDILGVLNMMDPHVAQSLGAASSLAGQYQNRAASYGNPYSNILSGIGGLGSLFGGGAAAAGLGGLSAGGDAGMLVSGGDMAAGDAAGLFASAAAA